MLGLAKLCRTACPSICIKVSIMSIYPNFWDRRFSKRGKLICTAEGIYFAWRNSSSVCPLSSKERFSTQFKIFSGEPDIFTTPSFHTLYQTVWFKQVAFLQLSKFIYLYFVSAVWNGFPCRTASTLHEYDLTGWNKYWKVCKTKLAICYVSHIGLHTQSSYWSVPWTSINSASAQVRTAPVKCIKFLICNCSANWNKSCL